MSFIIAQILGLVATVISISVFQFKNEKHILVGQFLTNVVMSVNFGLLGGVSAAWVCMVAAFATLLMFLANKKCGEKKQLVKRVLTLIFFAVFIVGSVITFESWPDIIVCVCALLFTLSIAQENSGKIRSIMFFNSSLWIIYDIVLGAWTSIILHCFTLASIIIGKIRLDRTKTQQETQEN